MPPNQLSALGPAPPWWPRILVILAVLAAAAWAGKTIRLETELLALMPPELPSVRGLDGFARQFSSDRELIVVAGEGVAPAEFAALRKSLQPALAKVPGVATVLAPDEDWQRNAPQLAAWMAWNLPPEQFAKLVGALEPASVAKKLRELPATLAGAFNPAELARRQFDPLDLLGALTGAAPAQHLPGKPPTTRALLTLTAQQPLIDFHACQDFHAAVKAAIQTALPGESRLLLTGSPAFTAEISTQMRRDMLLMSAVATVLISLAFWAFYRSVKPLGWILLGQFLALGVALLGARLGVGSLNVISMGFGAILLGIGMDYSILVYHHFASPFRADLGAWRRLWRGIWFSAATTAAAFLVLTFASIPGLRQLAALVACGLLACAGFATWLLPAVWMRQPPSSLPMISRASERMAQALERHGKGLVWLMMVGLALAGWGLSRNPLALYTTDITRFQPTEIEAFRGQMLLARNDASSTDGLYLLEAGDWDRVKRAAGDLANRFPDHPRAQGAELIPAPGWQAANARVWPKGVTERLSAAFDKAGLGSEWRQTTLAFSDALTQAATGEAAFTSVQPLLAKLTHQDADGVRAVVRIPGRADDPVPPGGLSLDGVDVLPVSWVSLRAELNASALRDLRFLAGGALIAIVVLCALAQRSARLVMLNLTALVLSLALLGALLLWWEIPLSAFSLLCVPLLLGLVIDYSLHVLMALEHHRGDLHPLYAHIGAPILLTALASCIGFGAPMLTRQPALQNFGLVMDLGIVSAVLVCLFVLPVLARWVCWRD